MWIKRCAALAVCALLIALCVWQVWSVDDGMQYVILAPAEPERDPEHPEPTRLSKAITKLGQMMDGRETVYSAWALAAQREETQLAGRSAQSQSARLCGLYGDQAALPAQFVSSGRLLYEEELETGENVMLLTEGLAIAIFRTGEPIDREVLIGETAFRVVGVLRRTRMPGEHDEYTAYVPLAALEKMGWQAETLTVSARPVAGAGAAAQFKSDMHAWQAGGDMHLLSKERSRALLPVRTLLTACGLCALGALMRKYKRLALRLLDDYRQRLKRCFAAQLAPRLAAYIVLTLLCGAGVLAALYGLVQFALAPVYIFPEWVPAVPVEIGEIIKAFWSNQTAANRAVSLRTPEALTLTFYRHALLGLCTLCALMLSKWYGEVKRSLRWKGKAA